MKKTVRQKDVILSVPADYSPADDDDDDDDAERSLMLLSKKKVAAAQTAAVNARAVIELMAAVQERCELSPAEKNLLSLCVVGPAKRALSAATNKMKFWNDPKAVKEWMKNSSTTTTTTTTTTNPPGEYTS